MKTKKIIKVLKFVKKYCKSIEDDCLKCPFDDTVCETLPVDWDIKGLEENLKRMEELKIEKGGNKKK
jgi:hypothetical protein